LDASFPYSFRPSRLPGYFLGGKFGKVSVSFLESTFPFSSRASRLPGNFLTLKVVMNQENFMKVII
jgi:hypothetical protein